MREPIRSFRGVFAAPSILALSVFGSAFTGCASKSTVANEATETDGGTVLARPLSVHPLDTAILFPLPETAANDTLLRANASGAKGELLPSYAVDALPALTATKNSELVPLLRVVSANIDPCFPSGVEGKVDDKGISQCRKQLRLILQPVHDDGLGKLTTDDVTVHTFHEMDEATFRSMAIAIVNARGTASLGDEAIDVHPIMKAQGLSGAFAKAIEDIFLAYAGASNLVKVTLASNLQTHLMAEKELLANVSHELRTPLARVRVALETAKEDPSRAAIMLREISRDLTDLERLTDDVLATIQLDFSDATSPAAGIRIRPDHVDVVVVLQRRAEEPASDSRCVDGSSRFTAVASTPGVKPALGPP